MSKVVNIFGKSYTMTGDNKGIRYVSSTGTQYDLNELTINDDRIDLRYYTLRIEYVYSTGGPAAQPFVGSYIAGSSYNITSPTISAQVPDALEVSGVLTANTTIRVTYQHAIVFVDISALLTSSVQAVSCCADLAPWYDVYVHFAGLLNGYMTGSGTASLLHIVGMLASSNNSLSCVASLASLYLVGLAGDISSIVEALGELLVGVNLAISADMPILSAITGTLRNERILAISGSTAITSSAYGILGSDARFSDIHGYATGITGATGSLNLITFQDITKATATSECSTLATLNEVPLLPINAVAYAFNDAYGILIMANSILLRMSGYAEATMTGSATVAFVKMPVRVGNKLYIFEVDEAAQSDTQLILGG